MTLELPHRKVAAAFAAMVAAACGGTARPTETAPPARDPANEPPAAGAEAEVGDDGDGMEVEGLLGTLDTSDIDPVLERNMGAFERCYQDGIGKTWFIGGRVELKFRVARDGSVKQVQIAEGDLGAWPIEKCILGVARAMTFARPKGGEAEFRFPIEFAPRGRVEPMAEALVETELAPRLAELAKCADEAKVPAPHEVGLTVYVGPGGVVKSAGFATRAETPFEDAWADCAAAKASTWKFPDPRGKIWKAQVWLP